MKFRITPSALADALTKVIPHADPKNATPVLGMIHVEASENGTVIFSASDRYTAVQYTFGPDSGIESVSESGAALIPVEYAKKLARVKGSILYQVTLEDSQLSFTNGAETIRFHAGQGNFPPLNRLFESWKPTETIYPVTVKPVHLSKFAPFKTDPLTFSLGADSSPIRVEGIAGRFVALIQPVSS